MMWHSLGSEPKTHVQLHLKNKIWRPLHLCSTTLLHYKAVLLRILTLSINHPALLDSSLLWIHDRETSFCLDLFERNSFILTVLWVHSSSIAFKSHDVTTCVWCHYESVYGKLDLSGVVWDLKDKDLARFMFYLPSCYCFFFFFILIWFSRVILTCCHCVRSGLGTWTNTPSSVSIRLDIYLCNAFVYTRFWQIFGRQGCQIKRCLCKLPSDSAALWIQIFISASTSSVRYLLV